jgi:hypothetical protein
MNEPAFKQPMMEVPSAEQARQAMDQAQRLFAHTLTHWAADALALRQRGLHRAAWAEPSTLRRAA